MPYKFYIDFYIKRYIDYVFNCYSAYDIHYKKVMKMRENIQ